MLQCIETTILHPAVVERALVYAEAAIVRERSADQRDTVAADLVTTEAAIRRLTKAIVDGDELPSLLEALRGYERLRQDLHARLTAMDAPKPTIDIAAVRRTLDGYLRDWQGLLRGHVHQGQQVLRRLIKGRLTLVPSEDGSYKFFGRGTVQPLLAGVIRKLASPTGFEPVFWP